MKISKSVIAVAVSSVLLFGCDFDVGPQSSTPAAGNGSTGNAGSVVVPDTGSSVSNKLAQITDTSTSAKGELRLKLSENAMQASVKEVAKGKVTVDLTYAVEENAPDDGKGNYAYISLYSAGGTSNDFLVGELILNEKGDVQLRTDNKDDNGKLEMSNAIGHFDVNKKHEVALEWGDGQYFVSIDGTQVGAAINSPVTKPVQVVSFKLGDTSNTTPYKLLIDNVKVIGIDSLGEETVFEDNFESHLVGDSLTSNPYNDHTNEAVVIGEGNTDTGATDGANAGSTTATLTDDFESYTVGTLISKASTAWKTNNIVADASGTTTAEVSKVVANGGINSLMLKDESTTTKPFATREFKAAAPSGSVSIDAYFSSANVKSTYINVGVGKDNADRYFELKQTNKKLEYEAGDTDIKIADITPDTWYTVNLSWTQDGTFSVSLNGKVVKSGIKQSTTGLGAANIPTQLTLYTGDKSGNANTAYFDNLKSDLF
ncbi:hypothetical protein [Vibrio neonatus]|uniref:hypothetical protein n=1 Tax=Vibrio neonatus TaxID=278860 RepID=UPI0021C457D5|nr:hypothetical protein [Vibrio neonatus]